MWREGVCIYTPEKEQKEGKNKVSMETKELCLIGNNTSKISETRSSIDMADTVLPCSINIALIYLFKLFIYLQRWMVFNLSAVSSTEMVLAAVAAIYMFFSYF